MKNTPRKRYKISKKIPEEEPPIIVQFCTGKDTDEDWEKLIEKEKQKIVLPKTNPAN